MKCHYAVFSNLFCFLHLRFKYSPVGDTYLVFIPLIYIYIYHFILYITLTVTCMSPSFAVV